MHWYKRDPNAFLSGTMVLTLEERGAYSTIIDHYYACDGKVLDDDYRISCVMNCNPRTWRRLKLVLFQKQKLSVCDGYLVPNRGEYTLNEARTLSERQSNRSRMRWQRDKIDNDINDNSMQTRNAITTTSTSREEESDSDSGLVKKEVGEGRPVLGEYDFASEDGTVFISAEEFTALQAECPDVRNLRGLTRHACKSWLETVRPDERKRALFAWFRKKQREGGTKTSPRKAAADNAKQQEAEAEAYRLRREEGARAVAFRKKQDEERRQRRERANGAVPESRQFPPVGEGGRDQEGDVSVPGL